MSEQDKLNELVSVHLGKAGDGSVVNPYVTPDDVDKNLLVAVPRYLNRVGYGIDDKDLPFEGYDAWNGYEFSTLLKNGFPVSGTLKFVYPANTPNIVESKSVKLYLNSFNMAKLIDSVEDIHIIEEIIATDIGNAVWGKKIYDRDDHFNDTDDWRLDIDVSIHIGDNDTIKPFKHTYIPLEEVVDVESLTFDQYNESEDIIKNEMHDFVTNQKGTLKVRSNSLRSNCRVTNQPDWGDVYIHIKGDLPTKESLLQYIVSMRRENHFHEEICECIYKRLLDKFNPEELMVGCLYTRRGGIDINPVRANDKHLVWELGHIQDAYQLCTKTPRQ